MKFVIGIVLVAVIVIAVLALLRPSGPRVTQIDRDREIDDEDRR
jgi:hypothetical protein